MKNKKAPDFRVPNVQDVHDARKSSTDAIINY